jgi:hypothetical protein
MVDILEPILVAAEPLYKVEDAATWPRCSVEVDYTFLGVARPFAQEPHD